MFNNLRIGTKLVFSYAVLILLMIILVFVGISRLRYLNSELDFVINNRYTKVQLLEEIIKNTQSASISIRNMILSPDRGIIDQETQKIRKVIQENNEYFDKLGSAIESINGIELFKTAKEKRDLYMAIEQKGESIEKIKDLIRYSKEESTVQLEYIKSLDDLITYQVSLMNQSVINANEDFISSRNILFLLGVLALVFAISIAFYLIRTIAPPINNVVAIAKRVAGGDLSSELPPVKGHDEIGELNEAFGTMHKTLKDMADIAQAISEGDLSVKVIPQSTKDVLGTALERMVTSLGTQMQEISEGINVLSSSTSEIMATVTQLASSSAETATSVSEATSTVEEVKQTADVVNEKAEHVSESGRKTATISNSGMESIKNSIAGMNRI
ncbi:MAG: HAMP domain-containing protein, partial [Candidatus Neomarinimicrobiota bacterium]